MSKAPISTPKPGTVPINKAWSEFGAKRQAIRAKASSRQDFLGKTPREQAVCSGLLRKARASAKVYEVPCTIEVSDIDVPAKCPIFGIDVGRISGQGHGPKDGSPVLVRKVWSKGYVPGNIIVLSWKAARIFESKKPEHMELFKGIKDA